MDFRSYNLLFVDPPHFCLPHFDMILSARGSPDLFFVKIDIANFYWSLLLPAPVVGYFTVSSGVVGDATYGTRRMPFGWKWSPIIAQTTLARVLRPLSEWFPAHLWQYIDDILMACCDPYFLQYALLFAKHLISQAGLFVSSKSSEFPVITITWLGKTVSGTTVTNLPSSLATALAHIWLLRCSLLTRRRLLRVLGYLQWLLCSNANCAPFLAGSYLLFHQPNFPKLLPRNLWISLLNAWFGAAASLHRRPLPPPFTMPIVYTDAAPGTSSFVVASCKPRAFATSAPTPAWVRSQRSCMPSSIRCAS